MKSVNDHLHFHIQQYTKLKLMSKSIKFKIIRTHALVFISNNSFGKRMRVRNKRLQLVVHIATQRTLVYELI